METMHFERIYLHTENRFIDKIEILHIEDIYQYMQDDLLEKLNASKPLKFIRE
jgi:hypothetical protein